MRRIDRRFLVAAVLTTVVAVIGYAFLSWQAHNYAQKIEPIALGGVVDAPFIVIGVFQEHWWLMYGVAMLMLLIKWAAKRLMG